METRLMVTVVVEDETLFGSIRASVSRWHDGQLLYNAGVYNEPASVQPLAVDTNVIPWLVATVRNAADWIVADALTKMGNGEEKFMHPVKTPIIS